MLPSRSLGSAVTLWATAAICLPAVAADPALAPAPSLPATDSSNAGMSMNLDVVAKSLDLARQQIQPSLGASVYNFSPQALQTVPQGENAPLNQVLLQAPGVVQDSFSQIHLRGEHADVQYRLNGVELPEGLQVFGQAIESRFAHSISLITGALPAQYGFQTAGVVDIQTRTGTTDPGAEVTMYGGQRGWLQPAISDGGRAGPVDWYVTADFLHNNIGIENPIASSSAIHDTTDQFHGLAYVSGIIDPNTRISMIAGGFTGEFQIPNNPSQPTLGFPVNGISSFNSAQLNETQQESTQFAILSLQKHVDDVDVQVSAFTRRSTLYFSPDWLGDLLFTGIAQQASRIDWATGVQTDGSWRVNADHTVRAGLTVQAEQATANSLSNVLPVDSTGTPTTDQPLLVTNGQYGIGELYGIYIQDEWHLLPTVTLNYGLRFDAVEEYTHESQVSPRINVVWQPTSTTTLHAGYSRYFVPPPYEALTPGTIANFLNTTAAPTVTQDNTVRAERSNYFDAGINQVVVPGLTVGVDYYFKQSTNLIDEGQFGAPIVLTAFNYASGLQTGVLGTVSYDTGPWSLYANAAWSRAMGRDINSAQFNFEPDELAYIANNFIHLDHDQTWTGSAGAAYTLNKGSNHPTLFSTDMLVQSGLRASTATIPNGVALPTYAIFNASIVQKLYLGIGTSTEMRLDVLNIGNSSYQIRNGTGVGVGAPQYGLGRTILAGLTQRF